ncbi:MAG: DUF192 domain-containing protein [Egibacteraceae bacterium]
MLRRVVAPLVLVAVLAACQSPAEAPRRSAAATVPPGDLEPSEPFGLTDLTLVGGDGTAHRLHVYDAHQPAARRRGLMSRESLPDDTGMVFRMPSDTDGGFWMKDTRIPLSVAFFDAEGRIRRILDMEPCTADPCPVYEPGLTYRGALEVNQGRFADLGVERGWRVELSPSLPPPS